MTVVNFDKLVDLMGNDKEMMTEMLTVFLEDIPKVVDEINNAWNEKAFEKIKAPAHKLKSSISWLGLDTTHDDLLFLENFSVEGGDEKEAGIKIERLVKTKDNAVVTIKKKLMEIK